MSLLEIFAEVENLSPEEIQALQEFIEKRKAKNPVLVGDLVGHLAGCLDDLPPDLSINPKYMEGFGE